MVEVATPGATVALVPPPLVFPTDAVSPVIVIV